MRTSLSDADLAPLAAPLREAIHEFDERHPGDSGRRQPVHTVYGGAHLFRHDSAAKLGAVALRSLAEYAPYAATLGEVLELGALGDVVYARVVDKLRAEPVEDFRLDFEDGYGVRPDAEEDEHAVSAARELARGHMEGTLPAFIGIRVKPLNEEFRGRSVRTLDLFVTTLVQETSGELPPNFVVTLPKVTIPQQTAFLAGVLERLERALGLPECALVFELMVETPQLIVGDDGVCPLPRVVEAAAGRVVAAHFGTYDYTAALNITARYQRMRHPACLFALNVMQVALAGRGLFLSDGSTAILPVPPHRAGPDEEALTAAQLRENIESVHAAWRLHYDDVRDSLVRGYYQGWDLHPAQLVSRYAAVFAFFLEGLDAAAERLRNFIAKAAQATLVGDVFDDAATGQGLLNYFLRAINSGAVSEEEVLRRTGLTLEELRTRSFVTILRGRGGG